MLIYTKKIKIVLFIVSALIFIIFPGCAYFEQTESSSLEETSEEKETGGSETKPENAPKSAPVNIGESLPITRGLVAKMVALTFGTESEINNTKRTIQFSDTNPEDIFDKYINFICEKKYIIEPGDKFMPEEYLTVSQAQNIIDQIDSAHKIKINITDEIKDKPISYNLWTEIYIEVLKNLAGDMPIKNKFNISAHKSVILALPQNNKYIKEGFAITDKGLLKCAGFDLSPYMDKEISFWTKGNELFALADITNENPIIENVYVTENNADTCTIFTGGAEKTYKKSENSLSEEKEYKIADVAFINKEISEINYAEEEKEKQVKNITDSAVNCVDGETYDLHPNFKVYYIQDKKVMLGSAEDILEGKTYTLCLKNNKVCAFIFQKFKN